MDSRPVSPEPSSFRDPSGFLFRDGDSVLLRQVNPHGERDYATLMGSGLYDELTQKAMLVAHEEVPLSCAATPGAVRVLQPRELSFTFYPYEWCFSQLKQAALLTLDIQRIALEHGMILKDGSAYNVQFDGVEPIFIDTLSFECYSEGQVWPGYSQFCRHFIAPLALMAKCCAELVKLLQVRIDGVDLGLASRLLPGRTVLSPGLFLHVHANARFCKVFSDTSRGERFSEQIVRRRVSREALLGMVGSLKRCVSRLSWTIGDTEWGDYYRHTSYACDAFEKKKAEVKRFLESIRPRTVLDLGANTGVFSRLAAEGGARVWAVDGDPACVEQCYRSCRNDGVDGILPLYVDLSCPTPATGWALGERRSFPDRVASDVVLALALVHHLAIGNNLPLPAIARFLCSLGDWLIIEFVPKSDSQTQRLLRSRVDIFPDYHVGGFRHAFAPHFDTVAETTVGDSGRDLFLMRRRNPRQTIPVPALGSPLP